MPRAVLPPLGPHPHTLRPRIRTYTTSYLHPLQRPFTTTTTHSYASRTALPPRPTLSQDSYTRKALKGSGPGGQKINKTSSAVQLTHTATGLVVKSQATRSRTQNESIARRILAEKIEVLERGSDSRVERKREKESGRKRSGEKKRRRKYRALAMRGQDGGEERDEVGEEGEEDGEAGEEGKEGDGDEGQGQRNGRRAGDEDMSASTNTGTRTTGLEKGG